MLNGSALLFIVIASVTKQSIQLKQETGGITDRLPRRQKKATRNDGEVCHC
jgi:hypothetical protein